MKALRLFTLALTLVLTPALVCNAYAQDDDDATEQTEKTSKKKDKKDKKGKKKGAKKVGAFKMEKKGFKKVFEKAKEANVPVMVLFTNPPTCPYCVKLEKEVLSNGKWKSGVSGKILCIYVDHACKDPMAKELSAKFPHQGIPTYVFANPHTMETLGPNGGYMTGRPIQTYLDGVEYACNKMKEYVDAHAGEDEESDDAEK